LFAHALVQSHRVRARPAGPNRSPAFNTVIWIVEREGNLPDWFLIDNPRVRSIPVAKPDNQARGVLAPSLLRNMPPGASPASYTAKERAWDFVDQTEGLLILDLTAISTLARRENIPVTKVRDAVRNYKVGVTEDPWAKIPRQKIQNAEALIK